MISGAMSGIDALAGAGSRSPELERLLQRALEKLAADPQAQAALAGAAPEISASIAPVCAASDFLCRSLGGDPALFAALLRSGELQRRVSAAELAQRAPLLPAATPEYEAQSALRRWRRHEL